ncbi:MAG: thiamine biosynthesis protein [Microbacteriaceae bacterium]|nr:thiamine biosynthesis protein [Microbacteriaceae bacterium]
MRHVFATMGTMATIDLTTQLRTVDLLSDIEAAFDDIENTFSLYRPDSELSQISAGRLPLMKSSARLRSVYADSLFWRNRTNGAFTPHRPDGVVDLNGIVKAIAIERAGAMLDAAGLDDWCVDVGGDILCRGVQPNGTPWTLGIVDPDDRSALLCSIVLHGERRAVATSGSTERGDHIWRDGSRSEPAFRQVTVVADDMITADVLATAIVSGGRTTLDDVTERWSIDVLSIDLDGSMRATAGFQAALAA